MCRSLDVMVFTSSTEVEGLMKGLEAIAWVIQADPIRFDWSSGLDAGWAQA